MQTLPEERIEKLLDGPYMIVDILPRRVPAEGPGQYPAVERYYRGAEEITLKKLGLLLKLNCYYDLLVVTGGEEILNPAPKDLRSLVGEVYLNILTGDALIVSDPDDHYMTVYGAGGDLAGLLEKLAAAEGLFVWMPEEN